MRTKLVCKAVSDLNREDFKKCLRLNFGPNGSMRRLLRTITEYPEHYKNAYAVMIKDKDTGVLLSWALVWNEAHGWRRNRRSHVYFYTRASYRRMGYGLRIAQYIHKNISYGLFYVYPHDNASDGFFRRIGMRSA